MFGVEELTAAVAGGAVAVRARVQLQPVGGEGDKVFPPTYEPVSGGTTRYAVEERRVGDAVHQTVLLDSVASQANRLELSLLEGWELGELRFPNPYVDFTGEADVADLGRLSALEAPHRIADAIFRDSLLDGTLFRLSDVGRAITESTPRDATGLYTYSPTALLFGMWDSTGPKGGQGSKFQRAIVSEIVGYGVKLGEKTASRIDPLGVEVGAGRVYKHQDPLQEWTLAESEAEKDGRGDPVPFRRRKGDGEAGRPSTINHGNVTPSIDTTAGGVTITGALQTTVLSLAALRRLRFLHDTSGGLLNGNRRAVEVAARTVVAALGLAALAYQYEQDYDLRSRCLLLPTAPPRVELLRRDGSAPTAIALDRDGAARLLTDAVEAASARGLTWPEDGVVLYPAPKLVELVRRSRKVAAIATDES